MTARILVVDDILPNVKLLEAKLTAEYYDVITASNGYDALEILETNQPDMILLDIMMPGMDGFEVCKRIKSNPKIEHIPVVMVTALDQPEDKIKGLSCGADDFLTKPVDNVSLIARVRNLTRLKMVDDELRMRQHTDARLGIQSTYNTEIPISNILIIDNNEVTAQKMSENLPDNCSADILTDPNIVLETLDQKEYCVVIVNLSIDGHDGLRICSNIRSSEKYRHISLIVSGEDSNNEHFLRALDLGVNDFVKRPIDYSEFNARISSQLKKFYSSERLRRDVESSLKDSIKDPMTNLYNRRYLNMHLESLCQKAYDTRKPLSIALFDIDFFKSVNDTFGHDIGDEVLIQFSQMLQSFIRNIDMGVRYGGEEFIVIMPETDIAEAAVVCERIRGNIADTPFQVNIKEKTLDITCSIGVASLSYNGETPEFLIKRADAALYRAKETGRNRVIIHKGKTKGNNQNKSNAA